MTALTLFATAPGLRAGDDQDLQGLVDQLKELTQKARQQRAADRWLLNAMEDLVVTYDWPWRTELVYEEFTDGDFTQNPQWQVVSGRFWVDGRLGLRSRTEATPAAQPAQPAQPQPRQDLGQALLGALLQEALKGNGQQPQAEPAPERAQGPAEIHLPLAIPGVFSVQSGFSTHNAPSEQGQIELGLYQNSEGSSGYRIVIYTGQRPMLEMLSIRSGRTTVIDSVQLQALSEGAAHELIWRRNPAGQITLQLDGQLISQVRDNSFRYPFKLFAVKNLSGELALQSVNIHGTN
ncbi:MAG: hypothetical protein B0D96_12765 [Candidatus Sedimenticola endophacoides]|uniref:Uncharacterized protein n=1 Tax=Candidatus Sedimenticola endophacoides TaxID=2548426 RepID=A0A6N4E754_9GAMM|nr:MAG: hypothetical protein B0D94_00905 [Candidatus Sedimenticola endophacoides]OQX32881.1 MAG: hypothetical protein B0D96_12765 [Candidatus Sedimenticola endophacoides]OQX42629.1 MAG: hypothetical protein B0D89_00870 [Candidatus Sedimenticola endophacoides]OQX42727.1 MAG: hypothetical protein B0D88_06120 [Candidatus Sedimenticola endophacoides]PUE04030.1 MAG: hypothetical protein C3L26_00085 [Candidatus Sedimenticola endophacoides]